MYDSFIIWPLIKQEFIAFKINIGLIHGFPCFNVCQVPRKMLKNEAEGRGFQQLLRDLASVNALENNVWSLLLHKFNHNAKKNNKNGRALFSTSSQLPCWFLHALSISKKILVSGHGRLSWYFPTVSSISQVKIIFTSIFILHMKSQIPML